MKPDEIMNGKLKKSLEKINKKNSNTTKLNKVLTILVLDLAIAREIRLAQFLNIPKTKTTEVRLSSTDISLFDWQSN